MRTLNIVITAAVLSLSLLYPGTSYGDIKRTSDAKLFRLELELDPVKPVVGINSAVLFIIDAQTNRAVDDAVIEIVPWMTVHSHGSPKKPSIKKAGAGRYRVDNIFYTMEGDWDMLVTVQKGKLRDTATIPVLNVKKR